MTLISTLVTGLVLFPQLSDTPPHDNNVPLFGTLSWGYLPQLYSAKRVKLDSLLNTIGLQRIVTCLCNNPEERQHTKCHFYAIIHRRPDTIIKQWCTAMNLGQPELKQWLGTIGSGYSSLIWVTRNKSYFTVLNHTTIPSENEALVTILQQAVRVHSPAICSSVSWSACIGKEKERKRKSVSLVSHQSKTADKLEFCSSHTHIHTPLTKWV